MVYSQEVGRRFWYEFDKATKYNSVFMAIVGKAGAGQIQTVFAASRATATYPAKFNAFVQAKAAGWTTLADAQTSAINSWLGGDWKNVQAAFEDFGQGTLYDSDPERLGNDDSIHTMDTGVNPPVGYHRWHASIRAIQFLQLGDAAWWERLDEFLGLAWAIQSLARPKQQQTPNPAMPQTDLQALRNAWLGMTPERRDRQYDLTGDIGYHPSPKQPPI